MWAFGGFVVLTTLPPSRTVGDACFAPLSNMFNNSCKMVMVCSCELLGTTSRNKALSRDFALETSSRCSFGGDLESVLTRLNLGFNPF